MIGPVDRYYLASGPSPLGVLLQVAEKRGKVVVFTRTVAKLQGVYRFLRDAGWLVLPVYGRQTTVERQSLYDRFEQAEKAVLLTTLGHNTGWSTSTTDTVVFLDVNHYSVQAEWRVRKYPPQAYYIGISAEEVAHALGRSG